MKIKEQTRKLAAGCSKHCFKVVDKTDEVSSKNRFEVVDRTDEVSSKHCFEVADGSDVGLKRFSKSISCKMNDFLVLTLLLTKSSG
ncbi:chlorohydrolase [Streptococcus pneumoniae]|nr:chlorohydrolase [Streptococcus pneumoniae]